MPKTLSPHQLETLAKMRAGGGLIERWTGGFWTIPGTAAKSSTPYGVPEWYASTNTILALAARGLIVESAHKHVGIDTTTSGSFVVEYRLVD